MRCAPAGARPDLRADKLTMVSTTSSESAKAMMPQEELAGTCGIGHPTSDVLSKARTGSSL